MKWINIFGLIIVILLLIPNMIYAIKNKDIENKCTNKTMNIIEQIGRYGSMFLMVFNIGIAEFGFSSKNRFLIWMVSMGVLILLYWSLWYFYFKETKMYFAILLAIIPSIIFILSGILLRHLLLVVFGMLFCVGHVYVTFNNK